MGLEAGQVVGDRYEVVSIIHSGGMGSVYRALDRKLANTPCAIKEILEEIREGPNADYLRQRFVQEMTSLANLDHPAIPRVRDFLQQDSHCYLVMDLIQGRSLEEELLESQVPLDPQLVVQDLLALLEALDYLHGQRPPIVHRDIKPANVVRDHRNGAIKLVDFGLARPADGSEIQTRVGTLSFAAPEQLVGRSEPRSDLYSLGILLERLLTGKVPNPELTEPHSPTLAPGLEGLAAIIRRATQPRLEDRYPTAKAMQEDLQHWQSNSTGNRLLAAQPPLELQAAAVPPRPWVPKVVIALLLLGLGFTVHQIRLQPVLPMPGSSTPQVSSAAPPASATPSPTAVPLARSTASGSETPPQPTATLALATPSPQASETAWATPLPKSETQLARELLVQELDSYQTWLAHEPEPPARWRGMRHRMQKWPIQLAELERRLLLSQTRVEQLSPLEELEPARARAQEIIQAWLQVVEQARELGDKVRLQTLNESGPELAQLRQQVLELQADTQSFKAELKAQPDQTSP